MRNVMRYILTLALAMFVAAPAFAAFQGPGAGGKGAYQGGGFQGPGSGGNPMTVAEAKKQWDDAIVTLTGNIVSKAQGTKDKYLFRDATGEIIVEIDHKRWMGQDVSPANTVRITGEVDKDFGKPTEIDVKVLQVLR